MRLAIPDDVRLGRGLYTPAEAAFYARVPTVTIQRWLYGNRMGERVFRPESADPSSKCVTFLDFVQSLAVRNLRLRHKIPLLKIREAIARAESEYGLTYPFARRHTTYLFGSEIFVVPPDHEAPVQVSGRAAKQMLMRKVVEVYLRDLSFDGQGLAEAYEAFEWNGGSVRMNPQHRFGEPLIDSCGYTARSLWEGVQTEGSIESAAEAFGVDAKDVELAFRYFDFLDGNTDRMAA